MPVSAGSCWTQDSSSRTLNHLIQWYHSCQWKQREPWAPLKDKAWKAPWPAKLVDKKKKTKTAGPSTLTANRRGKGGTAKVLISLSCGSKIHWWQKNFASCCKLQKIWLSAAAWMSQMEVKVRQLFSQAASILLRSSSTAQLWDGTVKKGIAKELMP